ncbi:multidrug effflux MFS transporter [Agrobacterium rhizogenes]|uniref:multidrug effflux MFS transporter n=1 Tax=Rhizobium rhizogenes TaxID=359 RepID=UPI0015726D8A|nr:multidrug effflux MFS transporter [Rhizobium rhizogenes]NTG90642.1 multidrug effflux MFS transporter [Rhizobium rhizogenes]
MPRDIEGVAITQVAEGHPWRILATLSALLGFASISTDFYLPAMPTMALSLGASAGAMGWTISAYLAGFSLGQLLWGPIGDRYGRRLPVAIGLVLFIIGSAGCGLSTTAVMMICCRVVQAAGACAGVVLARAMIRDLYEGDRAAQMLSALMTVMAVAPLLGPVIGGQILVVAGWRAIFATLVAVGVLTLIALLRLPETLPAHRRNREPLGQAFKQYGHLIRGRRLIGYAGAGGFFFAGTFAYIAGSPFVYIVYHHVPARFYGLLFGLGIVGIMVTSSVNSRLVTRFGTRRMLIAGSSAAALAGILLSVNARTDWAGLWGLVVPMFLFVSATGFIVANAVAGALADFPNRAGAVSALVGAIQYGGGILGSALVGFVADGTPWPMGWVVGISGLGCVACAMFIPERDLREPTDL